MDDGESVLEAHTHSLSHTALQRQEGRVRDAEKKKRSEREREKERMSAERVAVVPRSQTGPR